MNGSKVSVSSTFSSCVLAVLKDGKLLDNHYHNEDDYENRRLYVSDRMRNMLQLMDVNLKTKTIKMRF